MSVDSIGTRIGAIQQQIAAFNGAGATSSTDFAAQLASAQTAASPATAAAATTTATGATPTTLGGGGATQYDAQITAAANKYNIDPALLKGLIRQESNFNASARSGAGASGLTQLMPGTAASLGVTDATDPAQAIDGGAKYLSQQLQRFGNDPSKALAAYNAGPGAVAKFGGIPPYAETQNYVQKVLGYAAEYRGTGAATAAAATATATTATSAVPVATQPVSAASLLSTAVGTGDTSSSTTSSSSSGSLDYSTL
jgi:soluble lytic murein transglycosylase-like protein